jgi:integrase
MAKRSPAKDRVNFTAGRVSGFTCPADKAVDFFWDAAAPGLGIRATKAGRKTYIYQDRLPGLGKGGGSGAFRMTLGNVGALTIEDARAEAAELAAMVSRGIDPRTERKQQAEAAAEARRQEAQQAATMADAWAKYIEANSGRWGARHLLDHQRMADPGGRKAKRKGKNGKERKIKPGALAPLMPMKLTEITAETVQAWLEKEAKARPTQAHIAFGILRAFLNWCGEHPDYKGAAIPEACNGRMKRRTLPPKKAKDDCLQREQLKPWFSEVRKLDPVVSAYLQGLLLTGARRNELAPLKWTDVDFKWRSMTIHDKVDGERTIPLTPYLAALLYALPRRNEFVFSTPRPAASKVGYVTEPRRAHNRALDTAGIEGLTLHGLRRSFGTLAEWVEAPTGVVAQIMGHKPSALAEKHYRRRPLDLLRLWHTKIEGWILEQAGIEQPDENAALGKLRVVK